MHGRNQENAELNRKSFRQSGLLVINILGSPGSGKTSLLEQIAHKLSEQIKMLVVEGDVETEKDAQRIRNAGVEAIQIQTHGACHLDAMMVAKALEKTELNKFQLLIIENIGNLICPAGFDLGENIRIVVGSTTEGDEKPTKYPQMYFGADVCVLNKIDLLEHVDFCPEQFEKAAGKVNQKLKFFRVSCRSTEGIEQLCQWIRQSLPKTD